MEYNETFTITNGREAQAFADHLHGRLQKVLDLVPPMMNALDTELADVGMNRAQMESDLVEQSKERLERSIRGGERAAGKLARSEGPAT